jgi:DNA-binding response OmpR family regulator
MKRVLIVDDDPGILDSMRELLEREYHVLVAEDGAAALRVLDDGTPIDAIVLDMLMPILDGEGFLRAMRERDAPAPPVILASAHRDLRSRARNLAVADYLTKPFDVAKLEAKLARVLGVS